MLRITHSLAIDMNEIHFSFMRSRGPGGQNVNKLETAVLLRFNIARSASLSETLRERLLAVLAARLTREGDLIIKAGRLRTQERNRQDALERLTEILAKAVIPAKKRHQTKPTFASIQRRLHKKKHMAERKKWRGKVAKEE